MTRIGSWHSGIIFSGFDSSNVIFDIWLISNDLEKSLPMSQVVRRFCSSFSKNDVPEPCRNPRIAGWMYNSHVVVISFSRGFHWHRDLNLDIIHWRYLAGWHGSNMTPLSWKRHLNHRAGKGWLFPICFQEQSWKSKTCQRKQTSDFFHRMVCWKSKINKKNIHGCFQK